MPIASFAAAALTPRDAWLYSNAVAERLASVIQAARVTPQKISLTLYLNDERAVVTGLGAKAWYGEFPDGAVRIPVTGPEQNSEDTVVALISALISSKA